jgi:hypothetical protein
MFTAAPQVNDFWCNFGAGSKQSLPSLCLRAKPKVRILSRPSVLLFFGVWFWCVVLPHLCPQSPCSAHCDGHAKWPGARISLQQRCLGSRGSEVLFSQITDICCRGWNRPAGAERRSATSHLCATSLNFEVSPWSWYPNHTLYTRSLSSDSTFWQGRLTASKLTIWVLQIF